MKKIHNLAFIGYVILGLTPVLSAQTNVINLSDLSDHTTAYVSTHEFRGKHHHDHYKADHDTVKYLLVVDATDHLDDNTISKPKITDDHDIHLKLDVVSAIDHIFTNDNILFDYRGHKLTEESKKVLDKVADVMLLHPYAVFELGAHTDARGVYADNMLLSQKRLDSAIKYLESKGVNKDQIVPVAYGEAVLKNVCDSDSHCSEEVHAGNRRIEIKILSLGK